MQPGFERRTEWHLGSSGHGFEVAFMRQGIRQSRASQPLPLLFLYLSTRSPSLDIAVREEAAAGTLRVVVDRAAASVGADANNVTTDKVLASDIAAVANEGGGARVDVTNAQPSADVGTADSQLEKPTGSNSTATAEQSDAADPVDFRPFVFVYKSGRVHRFHGTDTVPPGIDKPTGVASTDITISNGVSARLYLPPMGRRKHKKLPVLVYFHGGAFVIESPFSPLYHAFLNTLVAKALVLAVSVHYRLAPEHPLPAAYDDAWAALQWTAANCRSSSGPVTWLADHGDPTRIFLAGDSSGGNIAHNLAVRAGADRALLPSATAISGLVLLNPYFWGSEPVGSEPGDRWAREGLEQTWALVCGGRYGIDDPHVNPLAASERLRLMAGERVLVTIAGKDNFRDRGVAYAEGLRRCGWKGEVEVYVTEGEVHVHFVGNPRSDKAQRETDKVAEFIAGHRRG